MAARLGSLDSPFGRSLEAMARSMRSTQLGLLVFAVAVGVMSGLGAVVFREMILGFTWLATGYAEFGQQGRVPSLHFPGLGIWFLLVIPAIGGLIYGPLIQRFAPEARGHGVPEVILAVAENEGRIRPPVTIVKALRRQFASRRVARLVERDPSSKSALQRHRRSDSSSRCRGTGCVCLLRVVPQEESQLRSTRP